MRVYTRCILGLCVAWHAGADPLGPPESAPPGTPEAALPLYAPHGDTEHGFTTPWSQPPERSLWKFVRWMFSPNTYQRERDREPWVAWLANDGAYLAGVEPGASATWVGHSTFALHEGDDVVLTDPHWGPRALIPARESPPGLPLDAVPADAFAVISHNHYDHLEEHTVEALPDTVQWFVPLGLGDWFRDRGRDRVVELDWWQSARRGHWTITCLPSQHWSRRAGQGENRTLWCAWLIDSGERRTYFAGDTGYFAGFAEVGRRFGPIDLALLPIGAYAPRWFMKWQHMNPEEAVQAAADLRAHTMLGMHWGTFDLTDEPVDLPPKRLAEVVRERGLDPERHRALDVGGVWRQAPAEAEAR